MSYNPSINTILTNEALKMLNEVGYGKEGSGLVLNLVFNPSGAFLPGDQASLELEFSNNIQHVRVDQTQQIIYLSSILKWFKKDFLAVSPSLTDYINLYRENPFPKNYDTKFIKYDWTLIDLDTNP